MPQGSVRTLYGRWQQASPPYKRGGATVVDAVCTCGSGIKATKRLVILKTRPGGAAAYAERRRLREIELQQYLCLSEQFSGD